MSKIEVNKDYDPDDDPEISKVSKDDILLLIDRLEYSDIPTSDYDFVQSLREYVETNDYLTEKQMEVLDGMYDKYVIKDEQNDSSTD